MSHEDQVWEIPSWQVSFVWEITPFTSFRWSRLVLWSIISERLHCACIVWVDAERRRIKWKKKLTGVASANSFYESPWSIHEHCAPARSPAQKHTSIRRWSALDIFCLWKTEDGNSERHVLKKKKNSYSISLRRYGWTPDSLHSHCPDGNAFTVERALSCPQGGYIALHVEAQWDQGRLGWAHARDLLQRHHRSRAPATQWGSNHDERMEALLQPCEEQHTVLNTSEEKLIVKAKELPYMGYVSKYYVTFLQSCWNICIWVCVFQRWIETWSWKSLCNPTHARAQGCTSCETIYRNGDIPGKVYTKHVWSNCSRIRNCECGLREDRVEWVTKESLQRC